MSGPWRAWAEAEAREIQAAGRWRATRDFDSHDAVSGRLEDGRTAVSFAGNDYLGLRMHPAVTAAARGALERWGSGAGAARLLTGSRPVHGELEAALAEWKHAEGALLFPTGFMANLGVLTTLGRPGVLLVSDERNHASIIDGCRLSRAEVAVYPHGDTGAVAALLARANGAAVVVTDGVFSMDGDVAPLAALAWLCRRHGALLVVDEAHSVLGPEPDFGAAEVLRVGTLSKTLAAVGGFVAGPGWLIDLLRNRARSFVFTTALPPADAAAALAALGVLRSGEGRALRERLRGHVERLAPGHPSPILPLLLGDEQAALRASRQLEEAGLLVPAIRPPTVAPGSSRLRVSLSAAHTPAQVEALAAALARLRVADLPDDGGRPLSSAPVRYPLGGLGPEGSGEPQGPEGSGEPRGPEGSGEPQGGAPVGRVPVGQVPVGRVPVGQVPVGQVPVGQAPVGQAPADRPGSDSPRMETGPERTLLVVSGTTTEVGKTWAAAALLRALRAAGVPVAARKPVQSFAPGEGPTDAEVLAAASGENPGQVCPPHRWLPLAAAPPMAAAMLGRPGSTLEALVAELALPRRGVVVVEGVGGPRSPLADDGDTVDLADALDAGVVLLVAEAGLGAINAVRLAAAAFAPRRVTVLLNRYHPADRLHRANLAWLRQGCGLDVLVEVGELAGRLARSLEDPLTLEAP